MAHEHHHFSNEQLAERFVFSGKFKTYALGFLGIGLLLLIIGVFLSMGGGSHGHDAGAAGHHGHQVTWVTRLLANVLVSNIYFFTLAMGALVFICLHILGGGGWQTAIRRVPEAMSMYLPVAFIGFIVLFFFMDNIYEWMILKPGEDALIDLKRSYLNHRFFIIRNLVFFGVWGFCAWKLRQLSLKEDSFGGLDYYNKSLPLGAFFIIFFAISFSLFSVDWIKSLEPHWFSTIFGIYTFAGAMQSSITFIMVTVILLKRAGYMSYVNDSHMHDIGKYMFGFSVFWGYIWVAQYLLIWYSNIPEETFYYIHRYRSSDPSYMGYKFLFFTNVLINFLFPFLIFMTRNSKRTPMIALPLALFMLYGHWQDLFVMIMPGAVQSQWHFGLVEIGCFLTFAGIFLMVVYTALSKANLFPKNSPFVEESLHHSTGAV